MREVAIKYLGYGLNPVPLLKGEKRPMRKKFCSTIMSYNEIADLPFEEIGIATGSTSLDLEGLDFDLKNIEVKKDRIAYWNSFRKQIRNELFSKLLVQTTKNHGFHVMYRTSNVESNQKLAMNEVGEVLIETRGTAGYLKCYPSEGYNVIQGSFSEIPLITATERDELISACRKLDMKKEKENKSEREHSFDRKYIDKFPKYNGDIDIGIDLLEEHGWTVIHEDEEVVKLRRPDKDDGSGSADYFKGKKFLWVYTTSTDFVSETAYDNHEIFAVLECDSNYSVAYAKLYEKGFGNSGVEEISDLKSRYAEEEINSLSFISTEEDEKEELYKLMSGQLDQGLSTGFKKLDENYRIKNNQLNVGIGHEGTGKSVWSLTAALAANVLHGHKCGIIAPENRVVVTRKRLIEGLTGKEFSFFDDKPKEYAKYYKYVKDNFPIVLNNEYRSIERVLELGEAMFKGLGIKSLLLDPHNSFKQDNQNTYQANIEDLSVMQIFVKRFCTINLMVHPHTGAARNKKDEDGHILPPSEHDAQGGNVFATKCDNFYVWHRFKYHSDREQRNVCQFIVKKIKERETGGEEHPIDEFTELRYTTKNGFTGFWDCFNSNPMYEYMKKNSNFYS